MVNILRSCDEARCSEGNRVGVQIMSSKNSMVRFFKSALFSKSYRQALFMSKASITV